MRVALALSGQPRFVEICYKHFFSKIIERCNADVFIHSFWSGRMIGSHYPCANHAKASLRDDDLLVTADIPERLIKLYKPVEYLLEGYEDFDKEINWQYYSQWACKQLIKDTNVEYDMIIRSRFDLMCTQDVIIDDSKLDSLWVPSCCPYNDDGRVNDMFSISNWDVYDKITNAYLNLEEFSKEGKGEMEWALASQIQKHNIPVSLFPANYNSFDVLRSDSAKLFS